MCEENCVESEFKVHDNLLTCKKRQQMHTYTCYSTHTPCTHKQTHIIITYLTNCNNQNNNSEHLSLSLEIVYIFLGGIE